MMSGEVANARGRSDTSVSRRRWNWGLVLVAQVCRQSGLDLPLVHLRLLALGADAVELRFALGIALDVRLDVAVLLLYESCVTPRTRSRNDLRRTMVATAAV